VKIIEDPVVVVEKKPMVVVEKRKTGVLFRRWESRQWRWFRNGNKKKDRKYVGDIRNGGPNGQGTLIYSSGIKYVGEWKDGRIIYTSTTFFDGRKYVGEYNGVPNGQGTMIFENGHKYEGEWKNGEEWKGTRYDKDGDIDYKVVNGVRQ
jgi:hypothetical protein